MDAVPIVLGSQIVQLHVLRIGWSVLLDSAVHIPSQKEAVARDGLVEDLDNEEVRIYETSRSTNDGICIVIGGIYSRKP